MAAPVEDRDRELAAGAPNVRFEQADARALPFADGAFDIVVFDSTLSHVPEPERALAEAARVVRPGGSLGVFDGDYATTVKLLRPIRSIAHRFGGSHAQRDVLDLTLIEAAYRAGHAPLAAALAAERLEMRHESPLAQLLARRADTIALAA